MALKLNDYKSKILLNYHIALKGTSNSVYFMCSYVIKVITINGNIRRSAKRVTHYSWHKRRDAFVPVNMSRKAALRSGI